MSGTEKYLSPKELAAKLTELRPSRPVSTKFVRSLLKASDVSCLGGCARLSDVVAWWARHPKFQPRAKNGRAPVTVL